MWMGDGEGSQKNNVGLNVETPKIDNKQQYFYKVILSTLFYKGLHSVNILKTDYTGYFYEDARYRYRKSF